MREKLLLLKSLTEWMSKYFSVKNTGKYVDLLDSLSELHNTRFNQDDTYKIIKASDV